VGNLQQRAVPLTHIAGLVHEDLLGTPAQRPGAWDTWLNIIAIHYRRYARRYSSSSSYSRLRTLSANAFLFLLIRTGVRKRELERRSFPHRAFGPHPSAMVAGDALNGG
jgi:hypothetical protein